MLTYRAATDRERSDFLLFLHADAADYLEPTLRAMGASWDDFCAMASSVGEVRTVRREEQVAGFVWTELRDRVLHIHGIAIRPALRGQGLGTQVFLDLEEESGGRAGEMELGVHESNVRALRLYERLGFRVATRLPDLGFVILRKTLRGSA